MKKEKTSRPSGKVLQNVKSFKKPTHLRIVKSPRKVFKELKLFATDVDGVLTDAGMYYGESGEELKKFHTRDGMGIKLLQAEGVVTAIITMEQTKIVARRAKKLGISEVFQGAKDKVSVLTHLSGKLGIPFEQMAYMGDDVNDVAALQTVGYAAAPADCVDQVRQVVHYICHKKGGEGAVREVIDMILAARHR
ncbi:MAG: HAD hydrolase family protein [Nitrospirota bacterium]|nr:HAD hydrolase family protein [Nitrospirota bacterium]